MPRALIILRYSQRCAAPSIFFFSSRRRHTSYIGDWSSACALPISGVVPAPGADPALDRLRPWVAERLGAPAAPRELHRIEAVPVLHTGKPDRRGVAASVGGA